MKSDHALTALSALAQDTRLQAFRLLIQAGPKGMPAGTIATTLGVRQNTMSTNLGILAEADLVTTTRDGRQILYHAQMDGIRNLLAFLLQDCCGGAPGQCEPLLDLITCPC